MGVEMFDGGRPFLREEGLAAGLTSARLRGPGYIQLFRGVHIAASAAVDTRVRAQAALMIAPSDTAVSRHTAATLWGGAPPPDWHTHVTTFRPSAADLAARRASTTGERGRAPRPRQWGRMDVDRIDARVSSDRTGVVEHRGIRLTGPVRTFLDLAEDLDLVELVVLGDSLLRAGVVTPGALRSGAATPGRHRRLARRAAALVREGVDSPPESRTRMLCVLAGLPEPEVNLRFSDAAGRVIRRADLGYRKARVSLEYDGRQHAESPEQWAEDIRRREQFDGWGWRMVVITSAGLNQEPESTLARIVDVLRSRGENVAVRSGEWRRYFGPRHLRAA